MLSKIKEGILLGIGISLGMMLLEIVITLLQVSLALLMGLAHLGQTAI